MNMPYQQPMMNYTPNYGAYQYNPMANYQRYQQPEPTQGISGRVVQAVETINPNEVPMDGSVAFFPKQDLTEIYAKSWNADGTIRTLTFKPVLNDKTDILSGDTELLLRDKRNKMFIICMRKGLKLVMENPYSEEHFLRRYWCYSPAVIDRDRRDSGDYFKKPTQYWFLNCEPQNNLVFEPIRYVGIHTKWEHRTMEDYRVTGASNVKTARSMIHPQYADRFIRQYILDEEIWRGKQ